MAPQELMKKDNLQSILHHLRWNSPVTQRELAHVTGLQPSTVSNLVGQLREAGYVTEGGRTSPGAKGGKPGVQLQPNGDAGHYLGVMLRNEQIVCAVVDFAGVATEFRVSETRVATADELTSTVLEVVTALTESLQGQASELLGIGVAAGSVVTADGRIVPSADFPFALPNLPQLLRPLTTTDVVVVENDANATALFAHQQLAVTSETLLALVFSEHPVSIGAGIVIDGRLYRGSTGAAGEVMAPTSRGSTIQSQDSLATIVRFLDPEVVVLATDATEADQEHVDAYRHISPGPALARALQGRRVLSTGNPRAAVIGAAYLAYEHSIDKIIEEVS